MQQYCNASVMTSECDYNSLSSLGFTGFETMGDVQRGADAESRRWVLLRDMLVLQGKLIIDGLRDLLLVPASLIAGIVSLVSSSNGQPGSQFYELIGLGKQSERWINLFGAYENAPAEVRERQSVVHGDVDELVSRFESFVVDEYKRGGVTAQAKQRMDKILDAVQRQGKRAESDTGTD